MIIKMLTELRRRMDELSKNFNKEFENIRKNQTDLKDTITEIRNTTEGINSRPDDIEQISDLENRIMEITQSEQQKEKKFNEDISDDKSTCNAGDLGSIPGLGRSPGEGNNYPL